MTQAQNHLAAPVNAEQDILATDVNDYAFYARRLHGYRTGFHLLSRRCYYFPELGLRKSAVWLGDNKLNFPRTARSELNIMSLWGLNLYLGVREEQRLGGVES